MNDINSAHTEDLFVGPGNRRVNG